MSKQKRQRPVTIFLAKKGDIRGYGDACELVDWLNEIRTPRTYRDQTIRLIAGLKANAGSQSPQGKVAIDRLLLPIQQCPWKLVPRAGAMWPATSALKDGWYAAQTWPPDLHGLVLAARLSYRGLEWVRQCRCGKWFLGYNSRSRFCSPECKTNFEVEQRKTPEGKKRHRQTMRTYRANQKRRASRKKRLSRVRKLRELRRSGNKL